MQPLPYNVVGVGGGIGRMRNRAIVFSLAATVGVMGLFVARILWVGGMFRSIEPHFAGRCHLVNGPVGPEDLTIHPKTGVAYISACDRHAVFSGKPVPGAIFSYDLNATDARPINRTPNADISFQPHGLSLWVGADGREVLYVINHPPAGSGTPMHTVEVFDLKDGSLVHRASLTDPSLIMPNDLVAVGYDRFYLTNTHHHRPGRMQTVETYLQIPWATVLLYADGTFRPAIENLVFPNGINVSADGRTIYVATTTPRRILVYATCAPMRWRSATRSSSTAAPTTSRSTPTAASGSARIRSCCS